ncbi:MAG TPA: VOC family protein [Rhizobiaceae bacterium]|nr:VOC family protein [Rhizobiaceae bacterium]
MRPNIDGIAIILNARDVEQTGQFYEKHVGIKFERNVEEDGSIWLLAKIGKEVEMLVFPGDPKPGNTPIITFGLADGGIDTVVESLAASGVEIVTPVSEAPGGWSADFRDPNGQVMSFYQDGGKPKKLG